MNLIGDTMKNRELCMQMKRDLDGYQFGLHNIGIDKYKSLFNHHNGIGESLKFTGSMVTERSIADNIIKKGLRIVERPVGLRSTVMPIKELNDESFNYTYNMWEEGLVWNIIVAIPRFIKYDGTEYYIGDIDEWVNISNMLMFNPVIFSEFIYGYYTKKILEKKHSEVGSISHIFSDDLELFLNPYFFENFNSNDKNLILKRIFEENRRLLDNIKLANNTSVLGLIFRTSFERFVISKTREQVKRLSYDKK